ncbi:hypothetical protein H4R20_007123, partial [Coemansia guatemalensis]
DDAMEEDESDSERASVSTSAAAAAGRTVHIVNLPITRKTKKGVQPPATKKTRAAAQQLETEGSSRMVEDESDDGDDSYDFGAYFNKDENMAGSAESDSDEDL